MCVEADLIGGYAVRGWARRRLSIHISYLLTILLWINMALFAVRIWVIFVFIRWFSDLKSFHPASQVLIQINFDRRWLFYSETSRFLLINEVNWPKSSPTCFHQIFASKRLLCFPDNLNVLKGFRILMILHIYATSGQTTPLPQLVLVSKILISRLLIFERDNLVLVVLLLFKLLQSLPLLLLFLLIVSYLNFFV